VARLAWLAHDDHAALDQACDICLSYLDVDLAIRGRGCCTPTSPLIHRRGTPTHSRTCCQAAAAFRQRDSSDTCPSSYRLVVTTPYYTQAF
jgi:hypothetical protein